jgi:dihydroorotate dehydrogenase (NAD+) catalytic subunit
MKQRWRMTYVAVDLHPLLKAVVAEIKEYKVYKALQHDKHTVKRWLNGGRPDDPRDIGKILRLALLNRMDVTQYQTFSPIYDFSPEMSYEDNMFAGPPDLSWLWDRQEELPACRVVVNGLEFDCPIGVGSGPLTGNSKYTITMLNLGYGPTSFKTRRAGPKGGWERPQVAFALHPPDLLRPTEKPAEVLVSFKQSDVKGAVPNVVNSIGGPSEAAAEWQSQYEEIKRHKRGRYVGLSVIGEDTHDKGIKQDFLDAVDRALEVSPPFVELNISCPNLRGRDLYSDPNMLREVVAAAKQRINGRCLLFVKLPFVPSRSLEAVVKACGDLADAVVFKNTVKVRPVREDRDGRKIPAFLGREHGGLSGPSTFPLTLRGVQEMTKLRSKLGHRFSIIAVGGVQTADDVATLMEAGAAAVQTVTAAMFDPLLAWKVRYQLAELQRKSQDAKAHVEAPNAGLLPPRDYTEIMTLAVASEAAAEVKFRDPEFSLDKFTQKWNLFHQERSINLPGQAQRLKGKRKIDWIRFLAS